MIEAKIEKLKARLEAKKAQERKEVLERIKTAIKTYGFTRGELEGKVRPKKGTKGVYRPKAMHLKYPRYGDKEGNRWTGMGSIPRWMQPHIDAGKKKEDFLLSEHDRRAA